MSKLELEGITNSTPSVQGGFFSTKMEVNFEAADAALTTSDVAVAWPLTAGDNVVTGAKLAMGMVLFNFAAVPTSYVVVPIFTRSFITRFQACSAAAGSDEVISLYKNAQLITTVTVATAATAAAALGKWAGVDLRGVVANSGDVLKIVGAPGGRTHVTVGINLLGELG